MRHGVGEEILKVIARFVVIYTLTMTSAAADLENDRITGSFDSGTDRGTWVGIRE